MTRGNFTRGFFFLTSSAFRSIANTRATVYLLRSPAMQQYGSIFHVPRQHQDLLRKLNLTHIDQVFSDPRIVPWRSIPERDNCTLDATLDDGTPIRLHVKRHKPVRRALKTPAEQEADGIAALDFANIPTVPLVAWGRTDDGRSFLITEDLAGFQDAQKAVQAGLPFDRILEPTADLAARLHDANLHHRDLYLCHFFLRTEPSLELRLIDPARVAYLPPWPFRNRWIVKDLAQFWYSASQLDIPESRRAHWLHRYADQRKLSNVDRLRRAVERKSDAIARHDQKLRQKQPTRNVSIPQ